MHPVLVGQVFDTLQYSIDMTDSVLGLNFWTAFPAFETVVSTILSSNWCLF